MLYKKTIVLSNKENVNSKAVAFVNIQKDGGKTIAILKLYNLSNYGDLIFGICQNNKQKLKSYFNARKSEEVFKIDDEIDINGDIACVIVEERGTTVRPILWGNNDCLDVLFPQDKSPRDEKGRFVSSQKEWINAQALFEEPENLEEIITQEIEKEEIVKVEDGGKTSIVGGKEPETFYDMISDQVEDLFEKYPEEERLSKIVSHSRWVKVDYDNNGKEYVIGLIYEGDLLKYLAYGVPGNKNSEVHEDIKEYSQWLPLDPTDFDGEGYWIMYQDALTGDSVNVSLQNESFA